LREGDTNSKYFHTLMKSRRRYNNVRGILMENDFLVGDFSKEEIRQAV